MQNQTIRIRCEIEGRGWVGKKIVCGQGNFRGYIKYHCLRNPELRFFILMTSDMINGLFRNPSLKTDGIIDSVLKAVAGLILCPP